MQDHKLTVRQLSLVYCTWPTQKIKQTNQLAQEIWKMSQKSPKAARWVPAVYGREQASVRNLPSLSTHDKSFQKLVSRLQLLTTRSAVTFPAEESQRFLTGIKLYCLVTETHVCEQLAQSYMKVELPGVEPLTS